MTAKLSEWQQRPSEEANLFNPAFLCALTYEFLKEYCKTHTQGAPLTFVVISLSTTLHKMSRDRLPRTTITAVYAWLQDNEDLLVGFAERTKNIVPYVKEAILFGIASGAIQTGDGHNLVLGSLKAHFKKPLIESITAEAAQIIDRTKFMGRWLANSGSEVSVLAAWGVKP